MKEHPILFSAPMVKALLDGRKTQTRRIVKGLVGDSNCIRKPDGRGISPRGTLVHVLAEGRHYCPYGVPGDRLWVRETGSLSKDRDAWMYADFGGRLGPLAKEGSESWAREWKACPSIHMPRWASRLTLEITEVRVECVQDISEEDAVAEGFAGERNPAIIDAWLETPQAHFLRTFYVLNKRAPRTKNPWVWALTFVVVKT